MNHDELMDHLVDYLQTNRRRIIDQLVANTCSRPWWYDNPHGGPTPDPNRSGASHRCAADRPPIDDRMWTTYGVIVDIDGNRYTTSGQPTGGHTNTGTYL